MQRDGGRRDGKQRAQPVVDDDRIVADARLDRHWQLASALLCRANNALRERKVVDQRRTGALRASNMTIGTAKIQINSIKTLVFVRFKNTF